MILKTNNKWTKVLDSKRCNMITLTLIDDNLDGYDDEDTADVLIKIMIILRVMTVIMVMLTFIQIHFSELSSLDRPGKGKSSSSGEFFTSQP